LVSLNSCFVCIDFVSFTSINIYNLQRYIVYALTLFLSYYGIIAIKMEPSTDSAVSAIEEGSNQNISKGITNLNLVTDTASGTHLNDAKAQNNNSNDKSQINGKSEATKAESTLQDLTGINIPASISTSEAELPFRPVTAPAGISGKDGLPAVGKDVQILMSMLEESGLCGPPLPTDIQSAPSSRPGTAGEVKTPNSRPTAGGNKSSRPGTAERKSTFGYNAGGDGPEVRPGSARKTPTSSRASATTTRSVGGDLNVDLSSVANGPMSKGKDPTRSSTSSASGGLICNT